MSSPVRLDLSSLEPAPPALYAANWAVEVRPVLGAQFPNVDWELLGHLLPTWVNEVANVEQVIDGVYRSVIPADTDAAGFVDAMLRTGCGWEPTGQADMLQTALHETGHLVVSLLVARNMQCCMGIAASHRPGGSFGSGRTLRSHSLDNNPTIGDVRLDFARIRAGETADWLLSGSQNSDPGDKELAEESWRKVLVDHEQPVVPLPETLWDASFELAMWALRPNVTQIHNFARDLIAHPLLAGRRLYEAIEKVGFVEPAEPQPPLWNWDSAT